MLSGDSISSILGWISIACWIIVYSPQIYENYFLQSGEGLSILFVVVWLLGDLFNLFGALLAGLLPTVIILALYYTICDLILLFQIYYYRWKRTGLVAEDDHAEQTPLLSGDNRVEPDRLPTKVLVVRYTGALIFVVIVGVVAWWLSNDVEDTKLSKGPEKEIKWQSQVLGWSSAVLYLGARIPQIFKNFKTRCEGLSPALFFFAIFGNVTYVLSICAKSVHKEYLITNASWLAGSGLTVVLDVFILCQFFYYRSTDGRVSVDAVEE